MRAATTAGAAGRGQIALVTGEAGIGKTALIRALAASAVRPLWRELKAMSAAASRNLAESKGVEGRSDQ